MASPQVRSEKRQLRTERVNLAVTAAEKDALRAVAAAMGVDDHSTLLRSMSLNDVMDRADKMKAALKG